MRLIVSKKRDKGKRTKKEKEFVVYWSVLEPPPYPDLMIAEDEENITKIAKE